MIYKWIHLHADKHQANVVLLRLTGFLPLSHKYKDVYTVKTKEDAGVVHLMQTTQSNVSLFDMSCPTFS